MSVLRFAESAAAKCRALRPSWQQTMLRIKDPEKSLPYYRVRTRRPAANNPPPLGSALTYLPCLLLRTYSA